MHHARVVGVGTFCNKSSLILQRLVAEVDVDVGHVAVRDVVACPPHRNKLQYLRFLTSTAELYADVGHVGAKARQHLYFVVY